MSQLRLPLTSDQPLTSSFIDAYVKHYCKNFIGVFACNSIPQNLCEREDFTIICNLSPDTHQGTHWVVINANSRQIIYCDSFGFPPQQKEIKQFLKNCNRQILWNFAQLQDDNSNYCGYYCILFALFFNENDEKLFRLNFTSNFPLNDKKCIEYINLIVNKKSTQ